MAVTVMYASVSDVLRTICRCKETAEADPSSKRSAFDDGDTLYIRGDNHLLMVDLGVGTSLFKIGK